MYSARFQNLVAAVGSFLSRLDENSVAALVARLAGRTGLGPCHEAAINALVANLEGVHGCIAMVALLV